MRPSADAGETPATLTVMYSHARAQVNARMRAQGHCGNMDCLNYDRVWYKEGVMI